jgi:hypothetical protein
MFKKIKEFFKMEQAVEIPATSAPSQSSPAQTQGAPGQSAPIVPPVKSQTMSMPAGVALSQVTQQGAELTASQIAYRALNIVAAHKPFFATHQAHVEAGSAMDYLAQFVQQKYMEEVEKGMHPGVVVAPAAPVLAAVEEEKKAA